jgi:hypothetical protein
MSAGIHELRGLPLHALQIENDFLEVRKNKKVKYSGRHFMGSLWARP